MTIGCSTTEIELASLARWTAVAPPIGAAERRARLAAAQERMTEIGAAALLVHAGPSLRRPEEHKSELQSLMRISYAVFCLKKKSTANNINQSSTTRTSHHFNPSI